MDWRAGDWKAERAACREWEWAFPNVLEVVSLRLGRAVKVVIRWEEEVKECGLDTSSCRERNQAGRLTLPKL